MKDIFQILIRNSNTNEALAYLRFATYEDMSDACRALRSLKSDGYITSYIDFVVVPTPY